MSVRVVADNYIRPDAVSDFIAAAKELIVETHANDKGCISYGLYRDLTDPQHLTVLEEWESQEALDAHSASAHFQRLFPAFAAAADPAKPGVVSIYEPVD
ncbi:MAG: antibiotic biosynthesis monooxygenase [Propionibacteriaceae bacterium]|nr:antibiotic biosynthesis monooxygenase [Propionibacteriaceae bacterium]